MSLRQCKASNHIGTPSLSLEYQYIEQPHNEMGATTADIATAREAIEMLDIVVQLTREKQDDYSNAGMKAAPHRQPVAYNTLYDISCRENGNQSARAC